MAQRFCRVCRSWHDLDAPWPGNCLPERNLARSDLPTPRLIRDGLVSRENVCLDGVLNRRIVHRVGEVNGAHAGDRDALGH